ncbi:MAG: transcription antitermination factor NusB [Bacteroidales bacterium]|nr:transcription antitermination factor NusB [Bacteroidales bacterium]
MVSRRYLRIKTMQALYAYNANPKANVSSAETDLLKSVRSCYALFLWLFALLPEIAFYRTKKLDSLKEKYNPTAEDLNPNTKFVNNAVIRQIENNKELQILWPKYHILWEDETDLIAKLFHEIEQLPDYEVYMANRENDYQEDKKFVLTVIEKVFAENDLLHWYLGEKNTHWIDDYDEAMMMLYQNVKEFKESKGDECRIDSLYKSNEDELFCKQLFRKTIEHAAEYTQMIEEKLQNWELERVINLDMLLMQMALVELLEFPQIPIKVTLNEYIELAKWYSSDKSKVFVNGILDRLIVDLRDNGRIVKTGRGLYQN